MRLWTNVSLETKSKSSCKHLLFKKKFTGSVVSTLREMVSLSLIVGTWPVFM